MQSDRIICLPQVQRECGTFAINANLSHIEARAPRTISVEIITVLRRVFHAGQNPSVSAEIDCGRRRIQEESCTPVTRDERRGITASRWWPSQNGT